MKIITGRPGSLLEPMTEQVRELLLKKEPCLFLVPSQYTLLMEQELMDRLSPEGSFLLEVISPKRLEKRVFDTVGYPRETILNEQGKRLVLASVCSRKWKVLSVYTELARKLQPGFIDRLSATIADMKQSGLTAEALRERCALIPEGTVLRAKLEDLTELLEGYEEKLKGRLLDEEDQSAAMLARISRSEELRGRHLFIYGFDIITPDFADKLIAFEKEASSLRLYIETDQNSAPDGAIYAPVNFSLARLEKKLSENGSAFERGTIQIREAEDSEQIKQAPLCDSLFALGVHPFEGEATGVQIHTAAAPYEEVNLAAAEIRRALHQGAAPETIAVVYPQNAGYEALLTAVLPRYGIRAFVAEKRTAAGHPLFDFILASLAVVSQGWRQEDVLDVLLSDFTVLEEREAALLAEYAKGLALHASDWKQPFSYQKKADPKELEALEDARQRFVQPLVELEERLHNGSSGDDFIQALLQYLQSVRVAEKLETLIDRLASLELLAEADICRQIWNKLMDLLDQLHALLGDEKLSCSMVRDLLAAGIDSLEISSLPPSDSTLICGAIGNIRLPKVKTLIILGQYDTGSGIGSGLLSEEEQRDLQEDGSIYLGMTARDRAALAQLDLLKLVSSATEHIQIWVPIADETGKALRPGVLPAAVERMWKGTGVQFHPEVDEALLISKDAAAEAIGPELFELAGETSPKESEKARDLLQAYAILSEDEGEKERLRRITRGLGKRPEKALVNASADELYGRKRTSVSRVETFAECPYRHFLQYGIACAEDPQAEMDAAERGTMLHEAAERFTKHMLSDERFPQIPQEQCDRWMDEASEDLLTHWSSSPLGRSGRGKAMQREMKRTVRRIGRTLLSQYQDGAFKPLATELGFGYGNIAPMILEMPDGRELLLKGKIDRIDGFDRDGLQLRIVDYKSSKHKVDPTQVYWGLQLQMLLYMAAALRQYPQAHPAGFFYCRLADPILSNDSRLIEKIEEALAKELGLTGISLSDVEILQAQGGAQAKLIKKDGTLSQRGMETTLTEEQIRALCDFATRRAVELEQEIRRGYIAASPAIWQGGNACSYCKDAAICGFDPLRQRARKLSAKTMQDILGEN